MPHEIELKLDAPPKAAARLPKAPWLRKLITAPASRHRIRSVYFDTRSSELRAAGISLRVRRIGNRTLQTVKHDPKGAAGTFARQEWEHEVAGSRPDLGAAKDTPLARFKLKKLRRKLRPAFKTDVRRAAFPIRYRGNDLELAIDRGVVTAGRRSEPISEIEIEVKKGDAARLAALARRIASETAAGYGAMSKAERGYALRAGNQPVFVDEIALDPAMPAGRAFQVIALSCLHQVAANRSLVAAGDPEGVHQMRVGLRRFRAAMSVFKELIGQPDAQSVKRELKWLAEQLAPARDLDVLLNEGVKPLEREEPETQEVAALEDDLRRRHRDAFARAKAVVESERYHTLTLEGALWLAGGRWVTSTDRRAVACRDMAVTELAAGELSRRTRKIVKRAKELGTLDARRRHTLRIAIKKVRYGCEFFASLYSNARSRRRRRKLTATLKEIQSALGKLNDLQVQRSLARRVARRKPAGAKQAEQAFAAGLLTGKEQARATALLADACKAARTLRKRKPFWH